MTDANQAAELTAEQVAEYLSAHPDFLQQQPQLLETLELPHQTGGASSLLLHQIDRLKARSQKLEQHLEHVHAVAEDNERLLQRLQEIALQLLDQDSLSELLKCVHSTMQERLDADQTSIILFDAGLEDSTARYARDLSSEQLDATLQELSERTQPLCGRLPGNTLEALFAEDAKGVESAALMPLRHEQQCLGLLAIGAHEPDRFSPDMGTLFLDFLGSLLAHELRARLGERTPRGRSEAS